MTGGVYQMGGGGHLERLHRGHIDWHSITPKMYIALPLQSLCGVVVAIVVVNAFVADVIGRVVVCKC